MGQLSKHFHRESTKYQLVSLLWDLKKKDDLIFPRVGSKVIWQFIFFQHYTIFNFEKENDIQGSAKRWPARSRLWWLQKCRRLHERAFLSNVLKFWRSLLNFYKFRDRGRLQKPGTRKVAEARNVEGSENKAVSSLRSTLGTGVDILRAAMNSDLSLLISRRELVGNQQLGRRQEWCCFLIIYFWGSLFPPLPIPSVFKYY